MPGGNRDRGGGTSPSIPWERLLAWHCSSSCFLGIPWSPPMPSGHQTEKRERGWGSGKSGRQQNALPGFGREERARGHRRLLPISIARCMHNKDRFFPLHFAACS